MSDFDAIVVGGGIMGASVSLRLAEADMRVLLIEQAGLGSGASGVNAGTLSLQTKRASLMPYAIAGHELWRRAGDSVGYRETGGFTLAFTEEEASYLTERVHERREAGAPIELASRAKLRDLEPSVSDRVVAASYCAIDGYANASLTGLYYRSLLAEAGVSVREGHPVSSVEGSFRVFSGGESHSAPRLILAGGAWLEQAGRLVGVSLPIIVRSNIVSVTERTPPLLHGVVLHAFGRLTLKQKPNGTFLIGGAWQGVGTPGKGSGRVTTDSLLGNLRLAQHAVPAIAGSRVIRSWVGFEARTPDVLPLAGEIPGRPNAYVLGAVLGGYTIGPYIGRLLAEAILGKQPELPLFAPGRFDSVRAGGAA